MALIARKLSFLPLTRMYAPCPFMAAYASKAMAAGRRNNISRNAANDSNDTSSSSDDDEMANVDEEPLIAVPDDGDLSLQPLNCRVLLPSFARRPWVATQDETAVRFRMDMPGIAKEDVKVYLDNMKLVIKGKYPQKKEDEPWDEGNVLADNVGTYGAEILLPDNVKKEQIKSEMKDGMLLVTAPKEVTIIPVE